MFRKKNNFSVCLKIQFNLDDVEPIETCISGDGAICNTNEPLETLCRPKSTADLCCIKCLVYRSSKKTKQNDRNPVLGRVEINFESRSSTGLKIKTFLILLMYIRKSSYKALGQIFLCIVFIVSNKDNKVNVGKILTLFLTYKIS